MNLLDMRTVLFNYAFSNLICLFVIVILWKQNRGRLSGLGYWVADFGLQFFALVLIALRGVIPEILSTTISNAMVIGGTILIYVGLERFTKQTSSQLYNYLMLALFIPTHAYFVVFLPSLTVRNILFTIGLLIICAQCAWLMLKRIEPDMRSITRGVGYVFGTFCLVSLVRIGVDLTIPVGNDLLKSNVMDTAVLLTYQMLFIILTFSLFLMVNRRLFADLEEDVKERNHAETALRFSEEKFSKAFQSSPDAIIMTRLKDGRIIEVNDGFTRLSGYSRDEALTTSTINLALWADPQDRRQVIAKLQADSKLNDYGCRMRKKSGIIFDCSLSGQIIFIGKQAHVLSIIRDISEQMRWEAGLQLRLILWERSATLTANELMQEALDRTEELTGSQIGFFHFIDEKQNTITIQAWSTRTREEFCKAAGEGQHHSITEGGVWLDCVRQHKPVIHNDYASLPHRKGLPEGHSPVIRELVVPTLRNGQVVSVLGIGNKPSDYDQRDVELAMYIADVLWDIVEQKRAEEQIRCLSDENERLALTDELTGLANRRAFFMRGGEEIKRTRRYQTPLTLIMMDIDHFKQINDTFSHEVGDMVLQSVAKILNANSREVDVTARLGGEEFCLLLPNTKAEDAINIAERLRVAIEKKSYLVQGQTVNVTASIGVASFYDEMPSLDILLHKSDAAMYQAKSEGRNKVVFLE